MKSILTVILGILMAVGFVGGITVILKPDEVITVAPEVTRYEIIPQPTVPTTEEQGEDYFITAYCTCEICCGRFAQSNHDANGNPIGAEGSVLVQGVSAGGALPFGTIIRIEGLGTYVIQDHPADWIIKKYHGKIIDLYFNDHDEAFDFGKREARVTIVGMRG